MNKISQKKCDSLSSIYISECFTLTTSWDLITRKIGQFVTRDLEINYTKTKNINSVTASRDRINKPLRHHQDNTVYIRIFAYTSETQIF